MNPLKPDFILLLFFPGWTLGFYGICLCIAFWRCRRPLPYKLTLGFLITRVAIGIVFSADVILNGDLRTITAVITEILIGVAPYMFVRSSLGERIIGRLEMPVPDLKPVGQSVRGLFTKGRELLLRMLPHLRSTAQSTAELAKRGTTSTVAALMKLEEQRRVARSERLATAEQADPKSDLDKLIAKYGTYKRGMQAVTVPGPDGQQVLLWMPAPRQRTSNLHLWFNVLKTAGMAGVVLYFFLQLPSWLQPVAGVGIAGVGLLSYLHFNPLHLLGFGH